jgi:hypothetical protein
MRVEGGLTWRDEWLQLVHREPGHIEPLRGVGLEIGETSRAHGRGLLSSEAQDTTNRDELFSL